MDKIVEAMARAMCDGEFEEGFWSQLSDLAQEGYRKDARAALAVAGPMIVESIAETVQAWSENHLSDSTNSVLLAACKDIRNLKEQFNGNG